MPIEITVEGWVSLMNIFYYVIKLNFTSCLRSSSKNLSVCCLTTSVFLPNLKITAHPQRVSLSLSLSYLFADGHQAPLLVQLCMVVVEATF